MLVSRLHHALVTVRCLRVRVIEYRVRVIEYRVRVRIRIGVGVGVGGTACYI